MAPSQPGSLRIGVLPITDVVPFYIALEQGYFKQQGLNVELVPAASAAERDQLRAGTTVRALPVRARGFVARPDVNDDIAGNEIAVPARCQTVPVRIDAAGGTAVDA